MNVTSLELDLAFMRMLSFDSKKWPTRLLVCSGFPTSRANLVINIGKITEDAYF